MQDILAAVLPKQNEQEKKNKTFRVASCAVKIRFSHVVWLYCVVNLQVLMEKISSENWGKDILKQVLNAAVSAEISRRHLGIVDPTAIFAAHHKETCTQSA